MQSLETDYHSEPCSNQNPGQLDGFSCAHFSDLQTAGWEIEVKEAKNGLLSKAKRRVRAEGGDVYVP